MKKTYSERLTRPLRTVQNYNIKHSENKAFRNFNFALPLFTPKID